MAKKKEDVIGKDLIKDNEPETLKKFGLELTEDWDRNVLKNMDWEKRKGTAWKVEPCAKFLEEDKISFLNLDLVLKGALSGLRQFWQVKAL